MKKWYRVFEIINGVPTIVDEHPVNWFGTLEDAEAIIPISYLEGSKTFTVLPVYEPEEF